MGEVFHVEVRNMRDKFGGFIFVIVSGVCEKKKTIENIRERPNAHYGVNVELQKRWRASCPYIGAASGARRAIRRS